MRARTETNIIPVLLFPTKMMPNKDPNEVAQQTWKTLLRNIIVLSTGILFSIQCCECHDLHLQPYKGNIFPYYITIENNTNPINFPSRNLIKGHSESIFKRNSEVKGILCSTKFSIHNFNEDKYEFSTKRVPDATSKFPEVIQGNSYPCFFCLMKCRNDRSRRSINSTLTEKYTTTDEKSIYQYSPKIIINIPSRTRSGNSIHEGELKSTEKHGQPTISMTDKLKETKWPGFSSKRNWQSRNHSNSIIAEQKIYPKEQVELTRDEEKELESASLSGSTKDQVLSQTEYDDTNTIGKRDLSIQTDMSIYSAALVNISLKEPLRLAEEHLHYSEENILQNGFLENISVNTNCSDISRDTVPKSQILSPEENKGNQFSPVQIFRKKFPVQLWKSAGLFDDSYITKGINSHWMSFEPPHPIIHTIFALIYGIIMIIGCSGNSLVIFMFFRCRSLRTPANFFIVNLAISDFFMLVKSPIFILNSFYRGPVLGSIGCKIYGFIGGLTGTASIMSLTAIAIDRYFAIVHPLNPLKRTTSARAILIIIAIWVYSCVFSVLPLLGLNDYVSEGYLTSCSFDYLSNDIGSRIFVFVFFIAAWLFPISVIVFSYAEIFRIVREAEHVFHKEGSQKESFRNKKYPTKQRAEIKIAIISSGVILLWILSWSPYAIVALLGIFGKKKYITPFVSAVPAVFCKTASCIDPFVYSISHPRFQRELNAKFNICFPGKDSQRKSSGRDNSYVSATCPASSSTPASISETLCTTKCGPVSFKSNCPCAERSRSNKRSSKTLSLTRGKELNKENVFVDVEEIGMKQVSLERLKKNTKTQEINVELQLEQDVNKVAKENYSPVNTGAVENSENLCCQLEQQEIILHVCSYSSNGRDIEKN